MPLDPPLEKAKSRTKRGRLRLAELMAIDTNGDLVPDKTTQAALSSGSLHWAA